MATFIKTREGFYINANMIEKIVPPNPKGFGWLYKIIAVDHNGVECTYKAEPDEVRKLFNEDN